MCMEENVVANNVCCVSSIFNMHKDYNRREKEKDICLRRFKDLRGVLIDESKDRDTEITKYVAHGVLNDGLFKDKELYLWFLWKMVRIVVGVRKFEACCHRHELFRYVTPGDEALALMTFVDKEEVWLDMFENGGLGGSPGKKRKKSGGDKSVADCGEDSEEEEDNGSQAREGESSSTAWIEENGENQQLSQDDSVLGLVVDTESSVNKPTALLSCGIGHKLTEKGLFIFGRYEKEIVEFRATQEGKKLSRDVMLWFNEQQSGGNSNSVYDEYNFINEGITVTEVQNTICSNVFAA